MLPMPALRAGPPSPEGLTDPVPATVRIVPSGVILRRTRLIVSGRYTLPSGPTAILPCAQNRAWLAGPPSPYGGAEQPPVPAMVVMVPEGSTFRRRPNDVSRKSEPSGPNAIP